jgi:hypothetical protein
MLGVSPAETMSQYLISQVELSQEIRLMTCSGIETLESDGHLAV